MREVMEDIKNDRSIREKYVFDNTLVMLVQKSVDLPDYQRCSFNNLIAMLILKYQQFPEDSLEYLELKQFWDAILREQY